MTPAADSTSKSADSVPLTILAITYNEEDRLPGLLECVVGWAFDVMIVDSGSTDQTVDVAFEYGARVVQREFTSFSDQWNFAARRLPIVTPWSMKLDPDERLSDGLKEEIRDVLSEEGSYEGFYLHCRLWFMGERLHVRTGGTIRIWRTGSVDFGNATVNEHARIDGKCGQITRPIEHLDSPNLHDWWSKQNRNTTLEAERRHQGGQLAAEPRLFGDSLQRRMWLKERFFQIPGRYVLLWLYLWLGKGAWRDGRTGRAWVTSRVTVMRLREYKALEMERIGSYADAALYGGERRLDPRVAESPLQRDVSPVPPSAD